VVSRDGHGIRAQHLSFGRSPPKLYGWKTSYWRSFAGPGFFTSVPCLFFLYCWESQGCRPSEPPLCFAPQILSMSCPPVLNYHSLFPLFPLGGALSLTYMIGYRFCVFFDFFPLVLAVRSSQLLLIFLCLLFLAVVPPSPPLNVCYQSRYFSPDGFRRPTESGADTSPPLRRPMVDPHFP